MTNQKFSNGKPKTLLPVILIGLRLTTIGALLAVAPVSRASAASNPCPKQIRYRQARQSPGGAVPTIFREITSGSVHGWTAELNSKSNMMVDLKVDYDQELEDADFASTLSLFDSVSYKLRRPGKRWVISGTMNAGKLGYIRWDKVPDVGGLLYWFQWAPGDDCTFKKVVNSYPFG